MNKNKTAATLDESRDANRDPITGAPGAHPVSTGVGAAGGGAAGAAIGTAVGGPIGTVIGAVIGAVTGGLGGKAVGEAIDPTAEDAYWREEHSRQPYAADSTYEDYQPAYRAGVKAYTQHSETKRTFEEAEADVRKAYELAGGAKLPWDKAREASRASWERIERGESVLVPVSEEELKVGRSKVERDSSARQSS